jgi:uncharacterized Zn finger protein
VAKKRTVKTARGNALRRSSWDAKIRRLIDAQSREELAELVWSLTRRFPELREEFRERIALSEGDVDRLVADARREMQQAASDPDWESRGNKAGRTPDYSRLKHRLERLVEQGHCDAVAELGQEVIACAVRQVSDSHDEDEAGMAIVACLPIVFQAVSRSSLSGPEKILFAIEADLADDYGLVDEASPTIWNVEWLPEDWSAVADLLATRLQQLPAGPSNDFTRNYRRDQVSKWMVQALDQAGRQSEVLAVYEHEARANGSYERLVRYLVETRRLDEAEHWAREGLELARQKRPGIASGLAGLLCEIARKRRAWDVVAAHAAWPFFGLPSMAGFDALIEAAQKANCEAQVRAAALHFLETGEAPYRQVASHRGESRIEVAGNWPLPVPDYLVPLLRTGALDRQSHPHYGVLIEMAIAAKRPDEVLHWYDKLRATGQRRTFSLQNHAIHHYANPVAEAVTASHPERALEIYQAELQSQLPHANPNAYQSAAGYLRRMRPILKLLGREDQWHQLLAQIRHQYGNRPRFMDLLKRLDGGSIVRTEKSPRKRRKRSG